MNGKQTGNKDKGGQGKADDLKGAKVQADKLKGGKAQADQLKGGKAQADKTMAKDKKAGDPKVCCKVKDERWLKVKWDKDKVYCADVAHLEGTAKGIKKEVKATGTVNVRYKDDTMDTSKAKSKDAGTAVASLKGKGQNSFKLKWQACGVAFKVGKDKKMPEKMPADGVLAADGMTANTPKALAVHRLPDKAPEAVSFNCSSPKATNGTANYGWTAAFRLGVDKAAFVLKQTLQIKKAWLGKWVSFDAKADKIKQAWGFIKKSGSKWQYWDTTGKKWEALPRKVSSYTLNSLVFVQNGKNYESRDDGGKFKWPEAFAEPKDYEKKKKAWLKNIHDVWDKKFKLYHKDCTGNAPAFCEWDLTVQVNWSAGAGDKLVYAIWAAEWERSNASDWYLTEKRLGVAAHECGHLLGAYDEYTGGAIHPTTKKIEDNSIMGQNLTTGKTRHLDGVRDEAKKKVKAWIGRDWPLEVKKR